MKAETAWPLAITMILSATVIGNIAVMRIANNDPSFAIESDYYRKAVEFDSTLSIARQSAALGWTAASIIARDSSTRVTRLIISMFDRNHAPITGLALNAEARFNARANEIQHLSLSETAAGVYEAPISVAHVGEWEVQITAATSDNVTEPVRYISSSRIEIATAFVDAPSAERNRP